MISVFKIINHITTALINNITYGIAICDIVLIIYTLTLVSAWLGRSRSKLNPVYKNNLLKKQNVIS